MIASLLPGLRELRTPLAAGYMWLLFAWLLVEPSVPSSREELTGVSASISRLIDEGSVVALGAGITFVAYLVGTVYVGLLRVPHAAYRYRAAQREKSLDDMMSRQSFYVHGTRASFHGYMALSYIREPHSCDAVKRAKCLLARTTTLSGSSIKRTGCLGKTI